MDIKSYLKTTVAILGKPNVGKSSLLNAIMQKKVASVNMKPQTTRKKMNYQFYKNDRIIEFLDTPGFHNPKNKLDEFLNKQINNIFDETNLIFFLTDISRSLNEEDFELLKIIKKTNLPVFLIITKSDLSQENDKFNVREKEIKNFINILNVFKVSSIKNDLSNLINEIFEFNKKNNYMVFEKDYEISDNFLISEIIRETCLELLKDEVPYGIQVNVDNKQYLSERNIFNIDASIIIEKESHKSIVLGKKGAMIKEIGTISRQKLLSIFETKIFLKLFVKVDKNWRNNITKLKEFGYYN